MGKGNPNTPGPFDVPTVKELIELMDKHEVNEVDLRQGEQRIHLVRGGVALPAAVAAPAMVAAPAPPPPQPAAQASDSDAAKEPAGKPLYEIKSPTPGTFYARANPDAETYVKVGSKVTPDTVVCLIEAMKLFTEINAEVNGVISEILVQDAQPVEYGTVLFRVDTSG